MENLSKHKGHEGKKAHRIAPCSPFVYVVSFVVELLSRQLRESLKK
jgi:hypothetical protein